MRRFGKYEANARLEDIVSTQHEIWQRASIRAPVSKTLQLHEFP